jgi:hypothetical protein
MQNGRQDEYIYEEIDGKLEIEGGGGGKEHDSAQGQGCVRRRTFTKEGL